MEIKKTQLCTQLPKIKGKKAMKYEVFMVLIITVVSKA